MTVSRVLIANRGEITIRIAYGCRGLGIDTVLAISDADRDNAAMRLAGRSIRAGLARATGSHVNVSARIAGKRWSERDAPAAVLDRRNPDHVILTEFRHDARQLHCR